MSFLLEDRVLCDLEMLLLGAFNPLDGFLGKNDYESVVENYRLADGKLWAMPIVLPVSEKDHEKLSDVSEIVLKDKTQLPIAVLKVTDRWQPDLVNECVKVYGSDDTNHPYVSEVLSWGNVWYYGGKVEKIRDVLHYDFTDFRWSAEQSRNFISEKGWQTVVGFQTRNPMHRSHYELTKYAMRMAGEDAKLLLTPVVGVTQACDVNYHIRVRCYQKLMKYYGDDGQLVLFPLSMRMAGPREALWHAQIRKNYGCTHFVVGRDHAGPSYKKKNGESFYGPYDAHELLEKYSEEIGLKVLLSKMIVYAGGVYKPVDEVAEGEEVMNISGTEQRRMLNAGEQIPEWFTFPEIAEELKLEFRGNKRKGLCLYFVGLSGSGKTTLSNFVLQNIQERERERNITVLDADIIRTNLSKGLGFSREDRSANVRRIGYMASEIVKHHGIVLVANIAPYEEDRTYNRELISAGGNYVEIFVDTTLDKCEERDVKGLYKLAREGKIAQFTGISDPFERPENAEIVVNGGEDLDKVVGQILEWLEQRGFI